MNEKEIDNFYEKNNKISVNGGRSNALKILSHLEKWNDYDKMRIILYKYY
jgi:hypothetical protein